tara:strand:- start:1675 stop:3378 length:1704 start_codon:yes stop_codon:yes gene_type:complete
MCGIFALLNNINYKKCDIIKCFLQGTKRGPEHKDFINIDSINSFLGFHRLAINGYNDENSQQPFFIDNIYLICNGEIYNHKKLLEILNITPNSKSDCEIIIHMYKKYGIEQTLQMLDGVFAFILIDLTNDFIFVARDTYGVRPLFINTTNIYSTNIIKYTIYTFASEIKCLNHIGNNSSEIKQFKPGSYSTFTINTQNKYQKIFYDSTKIFSAPLTFSNLNTAPLDNYDFILKNIFTHLENAVIKRVNNTDREIACLLSGGLDSSIICALVKKHYKGVLHTWSIGLEGSEDLKYAQKVADYIGSTHHSIVVNEGEFLSNISNVILAIESYDTTTVRASVGNWLICKYIKKNSKAKVIFNGDGSDEVTGGYLYFHAAPDCIEFDKECRKLLSNIHYFDVLRSDRSISSHGLEARTPFLDRKFVQYYLSIDPKLRHHAGLNKPEKYLLREAIELCGNNLLPKEVLWRTKEAFSDGVSKLTKSWYQIIQDYIKNDIFSYLKMSENKIIKTLNPYTYNRPTTLEQLYYRDIFKGLFKKLRIDYVLPYFWMPNFVNATDASARTLDIYKKKI